MISLAIDASTYRGTVAVFRDRSVIGTAEALMRGAAAEALMPAVANVLADCGKSVSSIDRVICGAGPGSFTSLRIAAGIAKGIALGGGVPLYEVSSLGLTLASTSPKPGSYLVTLDALRDEWYAAQFASAPTGEISEVRPYVLVGRKDVSALAESLGATLVGAATGAAEPHAAGCAVLFDVIDRDGPVDLDQWEPAYGRLAEAQVKWEAAHGRPLSA